MYNLSLGTVGRYKINLREGAQPVIKPIRRVPDAIRDKLKETLNSYAN